MTIYSDVVRDAIGAAIQAVGLAYPVQVPGRIFNPPNDGKYFEIFIIQDLNGGETWGSEQLFSGDLRVALHWPNAANEGIYTPLDRIGSVAAQFTKGARMGRLLIVENPRILDPIEGKNDMLFPLIVAYQYYHKPA